MDSLSSIFNSTMTTSTTGVARNVTGLSGDFSASFQQNLLQMMLTSSLGGTSSDSGSLFGSGSDMMSTTLFSMIEMLLTQKMQAMQSAPTTIAGLPLYSSSPNNITPNTTFPYTTSDPSSPNGRPVGGYISQQYHTGHNGLDFGIVVGTPVHSTMNGKVVYAGWNDQGYGNLVIVENGPYRTYYAHLSQIPVTLGQTVTAGSVIGASGNTGNSTGPHLHYEVRYNGKAIDPTGFTLS